ncbi:TetR/AcrR family transcriptional regulator [Vannielia litorea]|uniref:TetR/AcrR family transcriptional regulator n=1 Tax=Vannielia litorea TaxID=1217970 RepID=UPI001C9387A4|nr:TetR/AcrR family transcriptional regulator [Vannielia litorea]MBY6047023.1 TetR/AcrR family transcriptional regulator [Vannielia litorea]MBY6074437.1 TetR/AcrR family transcriptional regulator [Vannielia litorea]MBY6153059.1 TetR/AcrR family transcriptional regulator [Vannielia litorea]
MPRRGYHHGNLRQALVEAAIRLIEEKGPQGFTLSEAAKDAGVTPAAVYRHFEGREDLLAEVAKQGYAIFGDVMEHAYDEGQPSAIASFEATGRAYLAFARKFPGHYQAMFEAGLSLARDPDLARGAARAQAVLERAAAGLADRLPPEKRPPAAMFSAHIWAMSHGVVELFARGSPGTRAPFPPEDLLESGIGIYLRGLGLIDPDE